MRRINTKKRGISILILTQLVVAEIFSAPLATNAAFHHHISALFPRNQHFYTQSTPTETDTPIELTDNINPTKQFQFRSRYWIDGDFHSIRQSYAVETDPNLSDTFQKKVSPQATVTTTHVNTKGNTVAVQVESALTQREADEIRALARCVRQNQNLKKNHFEHRSFGDGKGGNECTYLAPLLQALEPEIARKVVGIVRLAWETAGWGSGDGDRDVGLPDPTSLGIRTSEHLSYKGWRSLEAHKDVGSVYTCMIAMADPLSYEGGEFFVQRSFFESSDIKPALLSAVVFLSDTTHGVRTIASGKRESFVTEFWNCDDSPIDMCRPTPEEWEGYIASSVNEI